jgi:hypothetical protein
MKKIILLLGFISLTSFTTFDAERDCVEEADRVYDLAMHLTGNPYYAENQRTDWLTGCLFSQFDINEDQLEAN